MRWVKKKFKNPFVQHLALGFIEWLKQQWIEVKVANAMRDIDKQTEQIKKIWEEQDDRREPIIVEKGVFGDEGSVYRNFKPDCWRRHLAHQLAQAWFLQAMHNDYKKMKGIKEPPYRESGYQTTLKEWFQTYETK